MHRPLKFVLSGAALLFLLAGHVRPQAPASAEARLKADLKYLAGDECEGRGLGTKGLDLAADYVAREFAKAGLRPGGDKGSYFQHLNLTATARLGENNALTLKGPLGQEIALAMDQHFAVQISSGTGKAEAPLVFVGYGITAPEHKYDDYAGLDVAGKVVVVLRRLPRADNRFAGNFESQEGGRRNAYRDDLKVANAERHKAAAVLLVNAADGGAPAGGPGGRFGGQPGQPAPARGEDGLTTFPRPRGDGGNPQGGPRFLRGSAANVPVFQVRRSVADAMLRSVTGATLSDVEKDIDRDLKPRSAPLTGWPCRLETQVTRTTLPAKNVVGVLEGSGPTADETVVIGAHYDHVGYGSGGSGFFGGTSTFGGVGGYGSPPLRASSRMIHHGADDNASGTSAVLELARRFGAQRGGQGRRLVFMAFSAEESGLIGSAYYCEHPIFPLESTAAMINMDMVGRMQDDKVQIDGLGTGSGFADLVAKYGGKHRLAVKGNRTGYGASDHESFFSKRVPVLSLFTGFHEQYHMPTDRAETINVAGLRRIVDFTADVAADLRSEEKRPEFVNDRTPFHRNTALWAESPSFGAMPNYADEQGGVLLEGVLADTPAAKAGLKAGDRILAVAGKPVKDAAAYHHLIRALPPGGKVEVAALRDGKATVVQVPLAPLNTQAAARAFGATADDKDDKEGVLLKEVRADTPAAKAGLKAGDRLLEMAGKPVTSRTEYMAGLLGFNQGDKVELLVERDGAKQKLSAALAFDPTGALGTRTAGGTPAFAYFGVTTERPAEGDGMLVRSVAENTPASKAGVKAGDRIVAIGKEPLRQLIDYPRLLSGYNRGDKFEVTVVRDGKELKLAVTFDYDPNAPPPGGRGGFGGGPGTRPASLLMGITPDFNDDKEGVLVGRVREETPAAKAGIKAGDRITAVGGKPVKSRADYTDLLRDVKAGDTVEMTLMRDGKEQKVKVVLPQ